MSAPGSALPAPHGRWFAHRLFGLCGSDCACAPVPSARPAPQPATPRWRGEPPAPKKAA